MHKYDTNGIMGKSVDFWDVVVISQQEELAVNRSARLCFSSCLNMYAVLIIVVELYEKLFFQKMCLVYCSHLEFWYKQMK